MCPGGRPRGQERPRGLHLCYGSCLRYVGTVRLNSCLEVHYAATRDGWYVRLFCYGTGTVRWYGMPFL